MEHIRGSFPESNPQLTADSLPDGFDPVASSILAQHWFGWQHLGAVVARIVQRIPRESNA